MPDRFDGTSLVYFKNGETVPYVLSPKYGLLPIQLSSGSGSTAVGISQVKFVSKGGNDASGDGSLSAPYLTIQAAINSITDADPNTKPYVVQVAPGSYATAFTLKNGITVNGSGCGGNNFNAAPQFGATFISPTAAQSIDASFAGASAAYAAITNCALLTDFKADFNAIGHTGVGNCSVMLKDVSTLGNITFVGNATNKAWASAYNIYMHGTTKALTLTDMAGSDIDNVISDDLSQTSSITLNQAMALPSLHKLANCLVPDLNVTWTSASITNLIHIQLTGSIPTLITQSGAGVMIENIGGSNYFPDFGTNTNFGWGQAASDQQLQLGALNVISQTPLGAQTITFQKPPDIPRIFSRIIVRNFSTSIPLDFAFTGGTQAPGNSTYCPPNSQVEIIYRFGNAQWYITPIVQSGVTTLVNGVSPNIVADITARSRIVANLKQVSGAFGTPVTSTRVVGTRVGGGLFTLTSTLPASGATVATDQGTYDWHVSNND